MGRRSSRNSSATSVEAEEAWCRLIGIFLSHGRTISGRERVELHHPAARDILSRLGWPHSDSSADNITAATPAERPCFTASEDGGFTVQHA